MRYQRANRSVIQYKGPDAACIGLILREDQHGVGFHYELALTHIDVVAIDAFAD